MVNLITGKNLEFKYNNSLDGLNNINFSINKGEVILITGDSGCGKSTLIKCLNGLIPEVLEGKLSGELFLENNLYKDLKMYELNKRIGSVFQNPRSQFFTTNTTAELVFPMENYQYSKKDMDDNLSEVIRKFNIKTLLNRNIFELSSGERQMIALASALILNQDIVLFDEPSANLDYGNAMKLGKIIKNIKQQGKTIIVADHRFFYLNNIVDRVFLMNNGNINIFNSENDFKNSEYDTRSFDLFSINNLCETSVMSSKAAVSIKNLNYKHILKDINLNLMEKEITVLLGKNGAGKTTLAKLLCKSYKSDKGEIEMNDLPFYIMQDPDFQLFGTSVYNELLLVNDDINKVDLVLKDLGLYLLKDKHPFDLSGGQKQRLQIAMALLCEKEFIIFDEPTSGLDVKAMYKVADKIKQLKKTTSILVISHDYEFIRNIADRIVYLDNGEITDDFYLDLSNVKRLNDIFINLEEI